MIGIIAATLTSIAAMPQLIKSLKKNSTNDLSWWTIVLRIISAGCWTTHGYFFIEDLATILSGCCIMTWETLILICKIRDKYCIHNENQ